MSYPRGTELPKEETHTLGTKALMKGNFSMHFERAHCNVSKIKFKWECTGKTSQNRPKAAILRRPAAYWDLRTWLVNSSLHWYKTWPKWCVHAQLLSCVWLSATPWTIGCQAPLSMEFSRQEYRSVLPFPPQGDLLDPGIEPKYLACPALVGGFFMTALIGKPKW